MTRRFVTLVGVIFLLGGMAATQEHPAVTAQANTIYVSADGKYESAPDTALVQFNISAQEETAKAAYDRASRAAEQIRQILRSNNVDPKTAEIGFFSVSPVYDYRSPKRKLIAYRVDSSVSVKLHDFAKIAGLVAQIADLDVTANQSVNYTLENIDTAKLKATEDAYQRARTEAAAIAQAAQRALGELSYASVDTFEPVRLIAPMARAMGATAMTAAPAPTEQFTPQKITVTAHVNALFTMK